jgi:aspartyl-tRNA(Asn)/glutamyl-tRNA(Gln) amidotransferase subunit B
VKEYDIVIGLEIHAELKTNTKVFCACKNNPGDEPNTNCCPVCVGMPGALPVLNQKAVELTIKAGLATNCQINDYAVFERKNYFYPDLSKAYQISQLEKPICIDGFILLDNKKVRINRIHLEEDAGKLIHSIDGSQIDYNRGGVPLIETVTEPDITSKEEAVAFLTKLRTYFIYSDVADCKLEQGGMRFDVNISVKPKGSNELGTRTEIKNLNSFKAVESAIDYESKRQIKVVEAGGVITQETRRWDDQKQQTFAMRGKEDSQDYRYFPDPDLLTVKIDTKLVDEFKKTAPMLPDVLKEKYLNEYQLPLYDTDIILSSKEISDFFNQAVEKINNPKEVSNWVMMDVIRLYSEDTGILISFENFIAIIELVLSKKITRVNAKKLFETCWNSNKEAFTVAKEQGMLDIVNDGEIEVLLEALIKENPSAVEKYKTTPERITPFFIGQIMKATRGKANAEMVEKLLKEKLN